LAITPWARLAPGLQVVKPARKRTVGTSEGGVVGAGVKPINTATVLGIRLKRII
jgi:hypothetical protein